MMKALTFTSCFAVGLLISVSGSAQSMPGKKSAGGFAVVNADGTLGATRNVTGITHPSAGVYDVQFKQNVTTCAVEGTIGGTTGTLLPGYIVLQRTNNIVTVNTFAVLTLLPADFKFDLTVTCSK